MSPTTTTPTHMKYAPFTSSPRSPPRSPRMSGLLLALQDVIGPTPDDFEEGEYLPATNEDSSTDEPQLFADTPVTVVAGDNSHTDLSQTLVHSASSIDKKVSSIYSDDSGHATEEDNVDCKGYDSEDEDQLTVRAGTVRHLSEVISASKLLSIGNETPNSSVLVTDAVAEQPSQPHCLSSLLSPVEMPIKPLLPLLVSEDGTLLHREDSIDSGYADSWTELLPFSRTPPPNRNHCITQQSPDMPFAFASPTSLVTVPNDIYEAEGNFMLSSSIRNAPAISGLVVDPCDVALPSSPSPVEEQSPGLLSRAHDYVEVANRASPLHDLTSKSPAFEATEPEAHLSLADASPGLSCQSPANTSSLDGPPTRPQSPVNGLASAKRKWSAVVGELSLLSIDIQPLAEKPAWAESPSMPTRLLALSPDVGFSVTPRSNTLESLYGCYTSTPPAESGDGLAPTLPADSPRRPQTVSSSPMSTPGVGGRVFTPRTDRMSSPNVATLESPLQDHSPTAVVKRAKGKTHARPNASMDDTPWDIAMDAGSVSSKAPFGFRYPFSLVGV